MASQGRPSRAQLLSVLAATVTSLACGTNYVYSAWGPQFAQRLKLSATESNLIGTMANLGMYLTGIPIGIMTDKTSPRVGIVVGVVFFILGYFPLAKAFDAGPGVFGVPTLCFFSFFTGMGSNSAFSAALKTAASNFPTARGSATSFPLAAFGLSAFFFATLALALPHDTSHFLLLLAIGTIVLPTISFPFVKILPVHGYSNLPQHDSQLLHRTRSLDQQRINQPNTGAQMNISTNPLHADLPTARSEATLAEDEDNSDTSSLLSETSSADVANTEIAKSIHSDDEAGTPHIDIRGIALVKHIEFWLLFAMMAIMAGIGLMTINNIGNDATALWKHYDPSTTGAFIAKRQVMHVSILSVCNFSGRLLSGIGSDILVNKYNQSRFWCLIVSASGFCLAQLLAIFIESPTLLVFVSGITGVSYGMLFGVYPSIVAHTFGVHGFSQNWGTIGLAPVIGGNVFNILYGRIYDSHSIVEDNGDRECILGRGCYRSAYLMTLVSGSVAILLCLWSIYHEQRTQSKDEKDRKRSDHERIQ